MMKVSSANVSGSHLKREFTTADYIPIFSWNVAQTQGLSDPLSFVPWAKEQQEKGSGFTGGSQVWEQFY